jgi:membrane-associated phospholipid phosphatase
VAIFACLCLISVPASGQTRQLHGDPAVDITVTSVGAAAWLSSEVLEDYLVPSRCRWCNVGSVDAGVREALIWPNTTTADTLSNVSGFVLMPLTAIGLDTLAASHDGAASHAPEDALFIAEATVVAEDVTQLTKLLVGRERPFVHALPPDQKLRTDDPYNNNVSFFSGHTSEVFALATASGTISTMRGYRYAPLTWSIGGAMAVTTAYLRIAADRHWFTDVVVGAVVGAAIGFAMPYVFHSAVDEPARASTALVLRPQTPPTTTLMTIPW